ncbi:TonB family protein [Petrimonas sp.]|uniref:TonB family protein n=1 Tax=Petrimonas sp. TaxID=2023866 RepID=UPI003F50DBB5
MKTKLLILFVCLFCGMSVFSQIRNDSIEEIGFGSPENLAEFRKNKGLEELTKFIIQNLQYPETALKDSLEGRVITQFWIDTLGNTYNHKIVRGVREDLDNEALRVVRLLKYEVPAIQRGKPIASRFTLPVVFNMDGTQNFISPESPQSVQTGKYGKNNEVAGFFFTLPLEMSFICNSSLNEFLHQHNYPSSDFLPVNFGIGLQGHYNRFILTFSFNNTSKKVKGDNNTTRSEYRATTFNLGYNLLPTYRYSLYPYVGFKGAGLSYEFKETISENMSFPDYLNTKTNYKEFTKSQSYLDLGVGVSFQWFYLLNLRAGYLLSIGKSEYYNENKIELSNFPEMKYNFYLNFTVGLGSIISNDDARRHPYFRNFDL